MSQHDVLVLGAGLAGLSAARDLVASGVDVLVLEARERVGGRVEQLELDDGRVVQLGGELVGSFHTAYLGLAAELGIPVEQSYVAEPGTLSWWLPDSIGQGDYPPGFTARDIASGERIEAALVAELERGRLRAVLDVTEPEPLPAQHPRWSLALAITPHDAGDTPDADARAFALAGEQLARFARGEPLCNVVRAAAGRDGAGATA